MESSSDIRGEKPLPTPRPRQKSSNEQYENYKLPIRSQEIDQPEVKEQNYPVPVPRLRTKLSEEPPNKSPSLNIPLNNLSEQSQKATGAIRKVPNVKNNLVEQETPVHMNLDDIKRTRDFDVISQTSTGSSKSAGDGKFHTPSPGDIIKSIGSSSKMLRVSIGERISGKTTDAKHKILKEYKNTKNVVESWASDSKSNIKSMQSKIGNISLKKKRKGRENLSSSLDQDIDQVDLAGNRTFHESFSFKSPVSGSYMLSDSHANSTNPPTYDEVVKESNFPRQVNITRSLNNILPKLSSRKESTDLNISESEDETTVKKVVPEEIYGKIKKIPDSTYENILLPNVTVTNVVPSDVATFRESSNSDRSFEDFLTSTKSVNSNDLSDRSISWRYCEADFHRSSDSDETNEPIYANNDVEQMKMNRVNYSRINSDGILAPLKLNQPSTFGNDRKSTTLTSEILREFDPLSRESFDAFIMTKMNHLSLLETLLSEETYGIFENLQPDDNKFVRQTSQSTSKQLEEFDDNKNDKNSTEIPQKPQRKNRPNVQSVIIHQNLHLKDSLENLLVDSVAETSSSSNLEKKTNWYIEDDSNSAKNNLDNPNFYVPKSSDKVFKSVQLTEVNDFPQNNLYPKLQPQGDKKNDTNEKLYPMLPSYEDSKNDEIVASNLPDSASKTRSFFNFGLRMKSSSKDTKLEIVNYIQKPPLVVDLPKITDKSPILFKLPSGVIEDMLKELNPRFVEIKKRHFNAYSDSEFKVLKEHLDLSHLTSIQFLVNHKFSEFKTDAGRHIFCFELNLSVPKQTSATAVANQDVKAAMLKNQRVSFVYGIHNKNEKCLWMQNIIRSVTDVFPKELTTNFVRAGWCYAKKSISQQWFSTWMMVSRRKLIFYDYNDAKLDVLDLRKARYIGWKDSDESINQLLVEKGSTIFIDCPPYTCYFIMMTERETKNWNIVLKDDAYANGTQLCHQQLTKDNVPVLIDKCVNFVYTHGTMSEGIYRKEGSSSNIQKLMTSLKKDAFDVQITRSEFNEHDVCSVLKRFLRDLPEPVMGKYAVNFLSVCEMDSMEEKVKVYRELLQKLPVVEYKTLKKLLGHLHFIATQSSINKMKIENLSMIFGPTLMQPNNNENLYKIDSRDSEVISDLIKNYKKLYYLSDDEIKKEQIMLSVLQKYHSAAENLSDSVKKSGDFKIWITLDRNPEINMKQEDKKQVNMIVTPMKTVHELCKEMESHMGVAAHQMTLYEVILNGELERPIHYNEKVLNIVLRWANWPDDDRKNNYLELRPKSKFVEQVERAMKTLPSFTPCTELKFADRKIKSMKPFTLELDGSTLNVLKPQKQVNTKVKDVDVANCVVYLGAEKKRENQMRWALTFVELNFTKRSRETPFIGYIISGNNLSDQVIWYTSIMYSMFGPDIAPNPEIVIA